MLLSLILSASFIYSGRIILNSVHETRLSVRRFGSLHSKDSPPSNVAKLVKITYISVLLGFFSVGLQLYSIFFMHNMYSNEKSIIPKPWPWLIFQYLFRCVDLGLGCTLAYVNPRQVPHRRRSRSTIFLRNCKLIAGSSLYVQNNQSSAESGDLASPPPTAKTSVRTLVEIGIENEGGNFIFHEEEDKK